VFRVLIHHSAQGGQHSALGHKSPAELEQWLKMGLDQCSWPQILPQSE
jgi:hypothetical protein